MDMDPKKRAELTRSSSRVCLAGLMSTSRSAAGIVASTSLSWTSFRYCNMHTHTFTYSTHTYIRTTHIYIPYILHTLIHTIRTTHLYIPYAPHTHTHTTHAPHTHTYHTYIPHTYIPHTHTYIINTYHTFSIHIYTHVYISIPYGFFFSAGPSLGESEVKTEIACSLSQLGLLCSTYILF